MVTLELIEEEIDKNYFDIKRFLKSEKVGGRKDEVDCLNEKLRSSIKDFHMLKILQEKYCAN